MKKWMQLLLIMCVSGAVNAEQFKTIKDAEVHYVVFNSTFLTPKVARSYELKRNGYIATINVSVLDRMSNGKPAMDVAITGTAKNLVGQVKTLEFKQVKEGEAIYYLAQFPFANEETYNFTLNVDAGIKGKGPIKFSQKLYVEE